MLRRVDIIQVSWLVLKFGVDETAHLKFGMYMYIIHSKCYGKTPHACMTFVQCHTYVMHMLPQYKPDACLATHLLVGLLCENG